MAKERETKKIAQRIDPTYFKKSHRLRRMRFRVSLGLFVLSALWIAVAWSIGDQTVYANGPVSDSHALFEADCASCHTESFGPVRDASCIECHDAGPHAPPGEGPDPACATCHAEHRGQAALATVDEAHCNRCHESHGGITSLENHIEFDVHFRDRIDPHDQFVRFNHGKHLDPGLLEGPLDCSSCHQPRGSGFSPIDFEAHCARCHTEVIDRRLPGEVVPHGHQPDELRDWITAVYIRRGEAADAVERANAATAALFKPGRGCLFCHVVEQRRIRPPEIPTSWLPKARFPHKAHRFKSCNHCHNMAANTVAETLTLPGVANCRECHHEGGARASCATCHDYH